MGAVFISYRRGDTEGQARALSIELGELLGKDSVFMDVDSIALGRDFRQVLQESLQACDIMLALIGPNWLDAKDAAGNRRLESPGDFVRQEIASALKRNIAVTPVLLQGAAMPAPDRLPPDLQDLAYRNGFELSHTRWVSDVRELFKRLGLMAQTRSYVRPGGTTEPASPFDSKYAAANAVAQPPAAVRARTATGTNAGVAPAAVAPPQDSSLSSTPARKGLRPAIIAIASVLILGILAVAGYMYLRPKPVDIVVSEITVPEVSKMLLEDAEGKVASANLKPVVVNEWNQDAALGSVIETNPPAGTKINSGDTVTLHVAAPGGWFYFERAEGLDVGKTIPITSAGFLHADQESSSEKLGSVEAGKSVRVLEIGGYGWAKVVVTD